MNAQMKAKSKSKFSPSEDELIKALVAKFGTHSWINIKRYFSNRTTRQLRERWKFYLNPTINQSSWTKEEDELLPKGQKIYGNCWKVISQHFLPNRTRIAIRNRFNQLLKQNESEFKSFEFCFE
jgi:myb proto-oncogene protein